MFFNKMRWSSHHWYASASDTPQQTRKNPQMDVVSMLKSKDAFVPCRNLSFGNRLSLTAMEKAAAFPLRAGFMPNSPMPMLDVCDWLLLTTVSTTTCGGMVPPFLFCVVSPLHPDGFPWPCCLGSIIVMGLMFVGVEKLCCCCVLCQCWPASSAVSNQHSPVCVVYNCTYFISGARRPDSIRMASLDDVVQTRKK